MINFRKFKEKDRELIKKWFENDSIGMRFLPTYRSTDDYKHLIDFKKRYLFIVSNDENPIGFLDFEIDTPEIGYVAFFIAPELRGKGFGYELLTEGLKLPEVKQVKVVEAGIEKENEISKKLLEKAGFSYVYTDEDNMLMYQIRL
jgi:RimJ/RimL family protein N-acetyltransferase